MAQWPALLRLHRAAEGGLRGRGYGYPAAGGAAASSPVSQLSGAVWCGVQRPSRGTTGGGEDARPATASRRGVGVASGGCAARRGVAGRCGLGSFGEAERWRRKKIRI